MNKKHILLFFLCAFAFNNSFAQGSNVSVNPLTGAGSVVIPLYNLSSGQVSVPVSLVYGATGIKPKDVEGTAGMGWNIQVGGQISRRVHGLPDDCTKDSLGNSKLGSQRLGWMNTLDTAANQISGFTIANNGSTCSYETADISYMTSNFPYRNDTEPDIFYVDAPGLSCQLIFDRTGGKFRPITYQDLVITYTTVGGTGKHANNITSFTITNDKGIKYVFGLSETTYQITSGGNQTFFKNKYLQYQNGISYTSSWDLTSVTDVNGNGVTLSYNPVPQTTGADSVALYVAGSGTYSLQYKTLNVTNPQRLSSIQTTNVNYSSTYLSFNWTTLTGGGQTGQTVISSITGTNKNFQFSYSPVTYYNPRGYNRSFLRSFVDQGASCSTPVNYRFSYLGETLSGSSYTTILPDSSSTQKDYWGYYSTTASSTTLVPSVYVNPYTVSYPRYLIDVSTSPGSMYAYTLSNSNRSADPTVVATGTLNKITYAQGGNTHIIYEPNDYYDLPSSSVVKGNGIRVKQVIDSVGKGSSNNIIRNYSYLNPSTGVSSGKPISLPQFAFNIPYGGANTGLALWTSATALSAYDLSNEDHTIMYAYAKVSQISAGSTVYQYNVPATYWDLNAPPSCSGCGTEWYPTLNYIARNNCTSSYGPIVNNTYAYPFIPNPNYDFERSLPVKVTSFNDAGTEVSESNYTYQRSYSPSSITAFKVEDNPNTGLLVKSYNKYTIFCNTSELTTTVISKVFDSPTLSVAQSDTTTYTYGASNYKLMTQVQRTNSDRSVLTNKISYVKDYTAVAGSNPNVTAIYNLQQENINIPIENYQQVTRSGTTKTTAASLTLFKGVTPGSTMLYLPWRQYKLIQPDGLTGFSPLSISGQVLNYDSTHYVRVANYDTYDNTGFPQTVDDNFKHIGTTIINHYADKPIAVFKNAAYAEVAFSDFDSDLAMMPGYNFSITGTGFTPVGSHAGKAYGLIATSQTVSHTVTKNAIAQNYIFSIWMNAPTGTNTLNISFNGGSATGYSYTGTGNWKYYEWKIPVSSYSSPMTISFTSSQNTSIDDILFYPDVAEVTTVTYDAVTNFKLAETNTNGISAYYTYDHWGRLLFAYDQDKNIVQKNTFFIPSDIQSFNYSNISAPTTTILGSASGFGIIGADTCSSSGATVTWHFGDGNSTTTALLASASHTYTTSGKKAVTATINSPVFGTYNLGPDTVNIIPVPASMRLTYENHTYSNGNISSVTFTDLTTGQIYSFSNSTLNGGSLPPGKYAIKVTFAGETYYVPGSGSTGSGYGSVSLTASGWFACDGFTASNIYNFTADLSSCTTLDFTVDQLNTCGT